MAPPPSPYGLKLGKDHTVGNMIGEGAFGKVYLVDNKGKQKEKWACKIVAAPKITKRKSSPAEVAHASLNVEYMLYNNIYPHLCGTFLPKRPLSTKDRLEFYRNDLKGFRCLTMEKMGCVLYDALPPFVKSAGQGAIHLGKTLAQLINITEAFHKKRHILMDVKPDNLMIACSPRTWSDESLAASIRVVDLGLVKPFTTVGGHRENEGTSQVQGTPLYASLNVHELQTPSRRDDIESMLYIAGEIVLLVCGIVHGEQPPFGSGKKASFLPWSQENSDAAIFTVKKRCVEDATSEFFSAMPKKIAATLFECLNTVRKIGFKEKPDYSMFRDKLQGVIIPSTAKSPAKRSASTLTARPSKKLKSPTRGKKPDVAEVDLYCEVAEAKPPAKAKKETPKRQVRRITRSSRR